MVNLKHKERLRAFESRMQFAAATVKYTRILKWMEDSGFQVETKWPNLVLLLLYFYSKMDFHCHVQLMCCCSFLKIYKFF